MGVAHCFALASHIASRCVYRRSTSLSCGGGRAARAPRHEVQQRRVQVLQQRAFAKSGVSAHAQRQKLFGEGHGRTNETILLHATVDALERTASVTTRGSVIIYSAVATSLITHISHPCSCWSVEWTRLMPKVACNVLKSGFVCTSAQSRSSEIKRHKQSNH